MTIVAPKTWYVYLLCDPDTDLPFYVGKGKGDRAFNHEKSVNSPNETNEAKKQVIRSILARSKHVLVKKVAYFDHEHEAYRYELDLIKQYREHLTNIRPGGPVSRSGNPYTVHPGILQSEDEIYYTRIRAAKYCRVSGITIDRWADDKDIDLRRYSNVLRGPLFKKSELDELLRVKPEDEQKQQ